MILVDLASQHPIAGTIALILVVYLCCLGGALAAQLAWQGHTGYWLAALGAFLFLVGVLWGRGYLAGGVTFAFVSLGVVAAIFGVALDLIFGPPFTQAGAE